MEGYTTARLDLKEQRDGNWLDVDHFPNGYMGAEDGAAEDEYQKIKMIEDDSGSHNTKDGQAEYGSRVIGHHATVAEDGPQDEHVVENVGDDTIGDFQMDCLEPYSDGPYYRDAHNAGVDSDARVSVTLMLPMYQS